MKCNFEKKKNNNKQSIFRKISFVLFELYPYLKNIINSTQLKIKLTNPFNNFFFLFFYLFEMSSPTPDKTPQVSKKLEPEKSNSKESKSVKSNPVKSLLTYTRMPYGRVPIPSYLFISEPIVPIDVERFMYMDDIVLYKK